MGDVQVCSIQLLDYRTYTLGDTAFTYVIVHLVPVWPADRAEPWAIEYTEMGDPRAPDYILPLSSVLLAISALSSLLLSGALRPGDPCLVADGPGVEATAAAEVEEVAVSRPEPRVGELWRCVRLRGRAAASPWDVKVVREAMAATPAAVGVSSTPLVERMPPALVAQAGRVVREWVAASISTIPVFKPGSAYPLYLATIVERVSHGFYRRFDALWYDVLWVCKLLSADPAPVQPVGAAALLRLLDSLESLRSLV